MLPADQLMEVAELAGGFIHEIKNHISTVNLNLQLLSEDFAEPQTPRERRAKQRIERVRTQCEKLADVSNDFLRFIRNHELRLKPTNLDDAIGEIVDFLGPTAKASNISINVYAGSGIPPLLIDGELFKQALLNLLLNAEQAMPEGGEIVLQSRMDDKWVYLDVIDTGTGIDPDTMTKLFRPFHTTKPGGTGLGLPTARKIIRAHGGDLEVASEPGHGTKFTIRLPQGEGT